MRASAKRAYFPQSKVNGGTTIYLAGYGGVPDEAGKSYAGDFDGQVRLSFARIRQTLKKPAASWTTSSP